MIFKKIGNMENVEVICHYLRIKILCRFCVLVYKETYLFLVSCKPIHIDFYLTCMSL